MAQTPAGWHKKPHQDLGETQLTMLAAQRSMRQIQGAAMLCYRIQNADSAAELCQIDVPEPAAGQIRVAIKCRQN